MSNTCIICGGPNTQILDQQLETRTKCVHQSVLETCWDCQSNGESGMSTVLLESPVLEGNEDYGRRDGIDGVVESTEDGGDVVPRTLPAMLAGIMETSPVSHVVRSKYLQRLKSRGVKKINGAGYRKEDLARALVKNESESTGVVVSSNAVLPLGRCEACAAMLAAKIKDSQEETIVMLRSLSFTETVDGGYSGDSDDISEDEFEGQYGGFR